MRGNYFNEHSKIIRAVYLSPDLIHTLGYSFKKAEKGKRIKHKDTIFNFFLHLQKLQD